MYKNNNIPQVSTKMHQNALDPIVDKLDLTGLSHKQRQFVFHYTGNAIAAADAAGYAKSYKHRAHRKAALAKAVFRLMQNEQVQRNIYLIQKYMEQFGVLSVAEAKDIISDIARNSESEARRLEAAKLALQWEGALVDPVKRYELDMKIQQHNIQTFQFAGPESNFLKSRKDPEVIDVTPEPEQEVEVDDIL